MAYLGLTVVSFVLFDTHWILSFAQGPVEHFSYAWHSINNGDQYLDGLDRVSAVDYVTAGLHSLTWLLGLIACAILVCNRKPLVLCLVAIFWVTAGVWNVWLFAIRSV